MLSAAHQSAETLESRVGFSSKLFRPHSILAHLYVAATSITIIYCVLRLSLDTDGSLDIQTIVFNHFNRLQKWLWVFSVLRVLVGYWSAAETVPEFSLVQIKPLLRTMQTFFLSNARLLPVRGSR